MPIAGIIITYVFCYELYTMVTEKNKGGEFEVGSVIFLIIKTAVMITLVTNSFNIAMAFADLGKWTVDQVTETTTIEVNDSVSDQLIDSISPVAYVIDSDGNPTGDPILFADLPEGADKKDYHLDFKVGTAFVIAIISILCIVVTLIMSGIIYIVAWSRMVMLLLYISVAPIPMATLMNREWIGSIGQNYIKNLLALMLQGFLMMVLLVIYSGLLVRASTLSSTNTGNPIQTLLMMMVSMFIVVKLLING